MAFLYPKTESKLLAAASYFPQTHKAQGRDTYQELTQWLARILNQEHSHQQVILGEDLQATPLTNITSHYSPLEELCETTSLTHIGDPHLPTYPPKNSPLDQWLLRLPPSAQSHLREATITTTDTNHSDYRALPAHMPIIRKIAIPSPPTSPNIPTTRDHPPFLLPIPKPLIELYQLGNITTQQAHTVASNTLQ